MILSRRPWRESWVQRPANQSEGRNKRNQHGMRFWFEQVPAAYNCSMPARGPYAKGKARRAEILDAAVAVIARHGYSKATVTELAEAVGISQNGLLHYFGSKDALFAEILRHRDELAAAQIAPEIRDFTDEIVDGILEAVEWETDSPGMAQLTLRMTGEATETDHPAHEFFKKRYEAIRQIVESAVNRKKERGQMPGDVNASAVAALVYASWDGLRIQWMYDKSIDVRANMAYLLRRLNLDDAGADSGIIGEAIQADPHSRSAFQ